LEAELPVDVVDACLSAAADRPLEAKERARALVHLPPSVRASAGEVFKRATNIAKGAPTGEPLPPQEVTASPHESEIALFLSFRKLGEDLTAAMQRAAWLDAFGAIAAFAPDLHRFFADVFVMVDDPKVRDNRLRLMRAISDRCSTLADFQLLAGGS
jgi:glycyl-tRNA synthetase beta chain